MKSLLKFITCGSVGNGKSTLFQQMLYDVKLLFSEQKNALEPDSIIGSGGGKIDCSVLSDVLMAEREQGISIDVAFRCFTTDQRSFAFLEIPSHEQYLKNITVSASFVDLVVIIVDATQGVLTQTRRDTRICTMMGIKHFVLVVNKMDLIHYDHYKFNEIKQDFLSFTANFNLESIRVIPVSATEGDNVTKQSEKTPWYDGLPILSYLETIKVNSDFIKDGFVMPVHVKPNHTFGGCYGHIESGDISVGDEIIALPSNEKAQVKGIFIKDNEYVNAVMGQSVMIQLDREVDVSRGCILVKDENFKLADMFTATILWMDETELVSGRNYLIKVGTKILTAMVMSIKYKIDLNTGNNISADRLLKNDMASCDIALSETMVFDKYENNKALGGFILIDRITNIVSACGVIDHSLRRSMNVVWQNTDITREIRSKQKGQKPLTLWFTGLSGSGKSTLANEVEKRLIAMGKHTMLLDGDNIRHGLNKNLGFKEVDRVENIRRIAEVSKLMNDAGIITITSFISPYNKDRNNAKEIIGNEFIEIYVSTPLEECEKRDVKGLYKKARAGEIPNFTGISSPFETPNNPDIEIDTSRYSIEKATDTIINQIMKYFRKPSRSVSLPKEVYPPTMGNNSDYSA
ncbi:adenylylsulfate kinase [Desulfosporosinus sp. OT]|nr:adenylyl-sulfate kinase [Desulfosporosinus sp. OT]EGW41264.1 adenylylsulfate kinase [Desulfosporosinus sp. OT]